jgi:peroxiredoxin Q/BCP
LGISFDTPEENKAFKEKFDFPFRLLSDVDHAVGKAYEAERPTDDKFPTFALRVSYLIDPDGKIARSYKVVDTAAHAGEVLADLAALQAG